MTAVRHFPTFTAARTNLRALLDAAAQGLVTTLQRDHQSFVVVPAAELAEDLRRLRPARAVVVAEGGGWAAMLPGVPVHGDAGSFEAAVDDLVEGLRQYAEDWERLRSAPNHAQHRTLVRIVELSSDEELRRWLLGDDEPSAREPVTDVPSVTTA